MGYSELIEQLKALPKEKQAEIFDYVAFLSARVGQPGNKPVATAEWTDTEFSQLAMQQALRGMEDEPVTYGANDIKECWQ